MTKQRKSSQWARLVGVLVGFGIAAALVASWRMPPGTGTLGLDLTASVQPTGQLSVSPDGRLAAGRHMGPGDSIAGTTSIRNLTGSTLAIRLQGLPSSRDLVTQLVVSVTVDGRRVFDGPLAEMIGAGAGRFVLRPARGAKLAVRVSLSPQAGDRARGHIEDVTFEPAATAVGR